MEYLIAGIRIDIPHRFTTGAFGMALAPFAAENKTETDAGRASATIGIATMLFFDRGDSALPASPGRHDDTFSLRDLAVGDKTWNTSQPARRTGSTGASAWRWRTFAAENRNGGAGNPPAPHQSPLLSPHRARMGILDERGCPIDSRGSKTLVHLQDEILHRAHRSRRLVRHARAVDTMSAIRSSASTPPSRIFAFGNPPCRRKTWKFLETFNT